ncbi:MAG: hypothetical protein ACR2N5_06645 [Solirubrobacterales bacterium]
MRRRAGKSLLLCLALAVVLAAAGCGSEEEETEAPEGEPITLGELEYNVQITRFLNPADPEDRAYLQDLPAPAKGEQYLGVFLTIENLSEVEQAIPSDFELLDTREMSFPPTPSSSPFALELGGTIPPEGRIPGPDSAAATGPIRGSLILFLIDEAVGENRPLKLEIPSDGGAVGEIELDI